MDRRKNPALIIDSAIDRYLPLVVALSMFGACMVPYWRW